MSAPRYQQIKNYLCDAIKSGKYSVGNKIPTENQLASQFSVSRMTVNKAIRDLVQANMLVRYAGVGTFVCDAKAESPLADIKDIAEEVKHRGKRYRCQQIKLKQINAYEMLAMQMGVPINSIIYRSVLVHFEDEIAIQLENRYVLAKLVPDYIKQDFSTATPHSYLSKVCPVSKIEHIVEAVLPSEKVQALLDIDATTPCLQVNRRTWSDDRLISFACLTHPGPRYKLRSIAAKEG